MKLDDTEVPARKIEKPDRKNMVLEYKPIFPLPDGIHKVSQYAKNELSLEEEERFNFGVDGTPPEVKLKKPQIKVFVPQSQWPNGSYKNPIDYSLDVEFSLTDNVGLGKVFVFIDNKEVYSKEIFSTPEVSIFEDYIKSATIQFNTPVDWKGHTIKITAVDLV